MNIIIELKGTATLDRIKELGKTLQVSAQGQFADVIANIKKDGM